MQRDEIAPSDFEGWLVAECTLLSLYLLIPFAAASTQVARQSVP